MKKFLIRLALFISPIIILAYPADLFISNGLRYSTLASGEIETWDDIYSGTVNSECLIYGSSRAWVQFNPRILEETTGVSTYNFGMDGHNFYLQRLRHIEYLKFNPKPKAIIYSIDIFTLAKRKNLYNLEQFLPFMLWNKDMEDITETYIGFAKFDYKIPLIRYTGRFDIIKSSIRSYFVPNTLIRDKGYKGKDSEWNDDDFKKAKATMGEYAITIDTSSVRLFRDFIVECKNKNIRLIFVGSPEYIEGQQFTKNRKAIMDMYRKFSSEYNIPMLDYSNDSISYKKEYFYNSLHLNRQGSEVFSQKLASDLVKNNLLGTKHEW